MFKTTAFSRCLRAWGPACAVLVCLAVPAWFVPAAAAQDAPAAASASGDYIQLQVDEKLSRSLRMRVSEMLTGGFRDQAQKTQFDDYYKKCVFPEWTVPDNFATKAKGARTPRRLIVSDLKRARQGEAYDRLNRLLLEQMVEFAKGNYHPVTRCNAMLMIGDLNVKQVDLPNPPQPLPEALPILLAAAQNDSLPDGVRMAALLGVIRHDALGANDEASRRKIGDLLLSVAVMRDVPRGRTKDGHGWFRRKAIERLSQRGSAGTDGAVAKGIAGVISESDAPLAVRADAAWALGRISLTPQIGLDPVVIAKSLEDLFIAAAREEIRRLKQDEAYVIDARKMKARLVAIGAALTGDRDSATKGLLGLATTPEQKTPIETLRQEIDRLLSKEFLDHEDLVPKIPRPDDRGQGGLDLGERPGGPMRPGAPMMPPGGMEGGLGLGDQSQQVDPAKPVSDKIMEELIRLVEAYEKRQGGS